MISTLVLSFAALAPRPAAFVIDCSTWPGLVVTEVNVNLVAVSGDRHSFDIEIQPDTDGMTVRYCLSEAIRSGGWKARNGDLATLIVEGTAKSPVRSVEWKSAQWVPVVRPVFTPPPKR